VDQAVCPFSCYQTTRRQQDNLKRIKTDFAANWHNRFAAEQGDETINFGGQEVKGQGHTTPKLDLETLFWAPSDFRVGFLVRFYRHNQGSGLPGIPVQKLNNPFSTTIPVTKISHACTSISIKLTNNCTPICQLYH